MRSSRFFVGVVTFLTLLFVFKLLNIKVFLFAKVSINSASILYLRFIIVLNGAILIPNRTFCCLNFQMTIFWLLRKHSLKFFRSTVLIYIILRLIIFTNLFCVIIFFHSRFIMLLIIVIFCTLVLINISYRWSYNYIRHIFNIYRDFLLINTNILLFSCIIPLCVNQLNFLLRKLNYFTR